MFRISVHVSFIHYCSFICPATACIVTAFTATGEQHVAMQSGKYVQNVGLIRCRQFFTVLFTIYLSDVGTIIFNH
jgi:hypothetical protein